MHNLTELLQESDDKADLTPMIDCVFLLLLFFIVTSTFSEETNLFNIVLPTAENAELCGESGTLTVFISKEGGYGVGDQELQVNELWEYLNKRHSRSPIQTIVIKGDRDSSYEKVVRVIDMAHLLDIHETTLAVSSR